MIDFERVLFGVLTGVAALLMIVIFGRSIGQYILYTSGSHKELPVNTKIYNFDTTKVIEDIIQ